MLYYLFRFLGQFGIPGASIWGYISFRALLALILGLIMQGTYFTMNQWMNQMGATTQQAIITGAESDELSRVLALKSSQGGYKVSIIWLPERMNLTSANKLLKLLEEPPQGTIFLMVCEEPEKLLETIVSRTQRIDVKRIEDNAIEKALIDKRGIDADAAHRIARIANGSWLKALESLNAGNENREFHNMFQMLMRLCYLRNVKDLKRWSEVVAGYGREKERRMLTYFQHQVEDIAEDLIKLYAERSQLKGFAFSSDVVLSV